MRGCGDVGERRPQRSRRSHQQRQEGHTRDTHAHTDAGWSGGRLLSRAAVFLSRSRYGAVPSSSRSRPIGIIREANRGEAKPYRTRRLRSVRTSEEQTPRACGHANPRLGARECSRATAKRARGDDARGPDVRACSRGRLACCGDVVAPALHNSTARALKKRVNLTSRESRHVTPSAPIHAMAVCM